MAIQRTPPIVLAAVALLAGAAAPMAAAPGAICLQSAARAARMTGVPFDTLAAIALAESGRRVGKRLRPWPWTLNVAGRGAWFTTREEARKAAEAELAAGRDSFDVGCFQINAHWHGAQFTSIDAMLDPATNALYAARFLLSLYRQTGDWTLAAGAYHSQDPTEAAAYRARLAAIRVPTPPAAVKQATPDPLIVPGPSARLVVVRAPQSAQGPGLGSLFLLPVRATATPLIGGDR